MEDLLTTEPESAKPKKKAKKKRKGLGGAPKSQGINVHVSVVNTAGDGHKKAVNQADDALRTLRGY